MCVRTHRNSHSVAFAEACNVTRDVYDFAASIPSVSGYASLKKPYFCYSQSPGFRAAAWTLMSNCPDEGAGISTVLTMCSPKGAETRRILVCCCSVDMDGKSLKLEILCG